MELQFQNTPFFCLHTLSDQKHTQEQTQEVRLTDAMPDVGTVLGAWGQVLLRSKQWSGSTITLSAGVMAWVLYEPEGGGTPWMVESWVPFQEKFDLPDSGGKEGVIHCGFHLCEVDGRSASARKLFVRVNVDTAVQALIEQRMDVCTPQDVPEDVQLLQRTYPVVVPMEAGEKHFELEEDLSLPSGMPAVNKILCYQAYPSVQEQKTLSDKVIFRGNVTVHCLYMGEDERVYGWDADVPFSQYGQLDREYEPDASVEVTAVPTSMELQLGEQGQLKLQMGLAGQFAVCQRQLIHLVEDAYSPVRSVELLTGQLPIPAILDRQEQKIMAEQTIPGEGMQIVDTAFFLRNSKPVIGEQNVSIDMGGHFQLLYYDLEGKLKTADANWEQGWSMDADPGIAVQTRLTPQMPVGLPSGTGANVQSTIILSAKAVSDEGFSMVCGLNLGEVELPSGNRPSLILRRAGGDDLWTIAKNSGSTVERIRNANKLTDEPAADRMLLIPLN